MKSVVKTLVGWTLVSIGVNVGNWLWDEVLEDKAKGLKDRLSKKNAESNEDYEEA